MFRKVGQGFLWLAQQGISRPWPRSFPFSALSLYRESYSYLPGCGHPTSPPSRVAPLTGRAQPPPALLPASLDGAWASTVCGES